MNNNTKRVHRRKNRQKVLKFRITFISILLLIGLSFVGIFRVIIIKANSGEEFEKQAIENQINKVTDKIINANRGSILDRNNQVLAISSTVYNIALDIRIMSELKQEELNNILTKVSEILEIDINELNNYFVKDSDGTLKDENDTHWKIIKKQVPYDVGKALESEGLTGVNLEADTKRSYPQNNTAAQTIGFIMGDTSWGLENVYNEELTGTPGRIYRTYEDNGTVVTNDIEPIKGNDIVTTLDLTLQQYAEEIVENTYKDLSPTYTPENVSIILMNPKTGEILANAQYPDFDLNNPNNISLLEDETFKASYEQMSEEEQIALNNSIWKNFAITDAFEPGSTFKAITVAAALEEGIISENDTFYCSGYKQVADYVIRCHKRDGHGTLTVTEALEKSCNMAMLEISEKMGRELFYKYQREFGFGYKTGIDLYGETAADTYILPIEKLNATELATSSFGQTFTATPMQIITSFAATINGGNIMKPYVVSQIIDENGNVVKENSPQILRKVISEDTSDFLRSAMIETLEEGGTAASANIPGYNIGGKTATAQQGDRSLNIYTLGFAAYMPAEDPEYLMLATISKPKDYINAPAGAVSVVPMVKEYFEKIIEYKAIPPSDESEVVNNTNFSSEQILLKDYTNKSLKTVIEELNYLGLDYQIVGGGGDTVTKQIPIANTSIDKNGKLLLYTDTVNEETELIAVPDTVNLSVDEATSLIESMGFEVNIIEIENESKEQDDNSQNNEEEDVTDGYTIENTEIQQNTDQQINTNYVYEQIPESGVFIEKGSIIKLKVKS